MYSYYSSRPTEFSAPHTDLQPQTPAPVEGRVQRPTEGVDFVELPDGYAVSELSSAMNEGFGVIAGEPIDPVLHAAWSQLLSEMQPVFFLRMAVSGRGSIEEQLRNALNTEAALAPLRGETLEATARFVAAELERFGRTRSALSDLSLYASTPSRLSGTILDTASAHFDQFNDGFQFAPYTLVRVLAGPGTLIMPEQFVHRDRSLRAYVEDRERYSQRIDLFLSGTVEFPDFLRSNFDEWQRRLPFASPDAYFEELTPGRSHYIRGAVGNSLDGVIHKAPLEPRIVLVAR